MDFAHSLFSVVDIRSDKGKHKNRLEIVSRTRQLEDEKGKGESRRREKGKAKQKEFNARILKQRLLTGGSDQPRLMKTCDLSTLVTETVSLDQTTETEVLLDDDIYGMSAMFLTIKDVGLTVHSSHDEANLGGVSGAGEVSVDLLLLGLVERDETVEDVVASRGVVGTALVVGEVVLHRADGELLLETIDLVEEENDRGLDEPPGVADGVEQSQGFLHTVHGLVFEEQLVVLGDGDQEENGGNILEAVNPLLTLGTLTTNVEHAVCQVSDDECGLGDTGGLDTGTEDILIGGKVIGLGNTLN